MIKRYILYTLFLYSLIILALTHINDKELVKYFGALTNICLGTVFLLINKGQK